MASYFQHGNTGPNVFLYSGQIIASKHFGSLLHPSKIKKVPTLQKKYEYFQSLFGCSPDITAEIWYRIAPQGEHSLKRGAEPQHLLWALLFMKVYASDNVLCSIVGGVDSKTFSFWTRYFIKQISNKLFNQEVCTS
jgi:hypothetical protein